MKISKNWAICIISIVILNIGYTTQAYGQNSVAKIFSVEGQAEIIRLQSGNKEDATPGLELFIGDTVQVGANGRIALEFSDGAFVRLGNSARLRLDQQAQDNSPTLNLASGKAHLLSRDPIRHPSITTPTVTAALRGTEFVIDAASLETEISVIEGGVTAFNKYGSLQLNAGEGCLAQNGKAPVKLLNINLANTVRWAVPVPLQGDWSDLKDNTNPDFSSIVEKFSGANVTNQIDRNTLSADSKKLDLVAKKITEGTTTNIIDDINKGKINSARDLIFLSRVLILNNQIDKANDVLTLAKAASDLNKHQAAYNTTAAVVALASGDLDQAEGLTQDFTAGNPAPQALTKALVMQASREIGSAQAILLEANALHPSNGLILEKLAELAFTNGDTSQALRYLDEASKTGTNSPNSDLLRGFIKLAQKETDQALQIFSDIIKHSGDPQAFFGAALAHIAKGDSATGEKLLIKAAHLDPQSSIYRSYLAKAFYHNNKAQLADRELGEAISRDENDPTPWLYRSYLRREQNRPVEALQDLESSIAKNDNRAVYRSSNLLDQDAAVRGVSLAEVFKDLGFKEIGRVEALKSLNSDYSNGAAHKFLAETQDEIFAADAALSEKRISDLLSPLTLNSLESIANTASFNEYSSLFNQNEDRTSLSASFDNRADLYSMEALYATISDRLGGALALSTDLGGGSKHGDSLRDYRLSGTTHILPDEFNKFIVTGRGQFREEDYAAAEDQEVDFKTGGANAAWVSHISPEVTTIIQSTFDRSGEYAKGYGLNESIYSTQVFNELIDTLVSDIIHDRDRESFVTTAKQEAQLIWDTPWLSTIATASLTNQDVDKFADSLVIEDSLGELAGNDVHLRSSARNDLTSSSGSVYSTAHILDWLHLTAGLALERVEFARTEIPPYVSDQDSETELNPKFGVMAELPYNFTLRSSYTETLLKSSVEDQYSIEPTSVGGVTQRFNDLAGTSARNVGVGLDWKIPGSTYIGGELISRRLSEPYAITTSEFTVDFDLGETRDSVTVDEVGDNHIKQNLARGYVYNILTNRLVSAFDYRYVKQEFTDSEVGGFTDDQRLSHTFRYFLCNGIFLMNRASWRYQEREESVVLEDGKDISWIFDLGVGYRLPKRSGTVALEVRNILGESLNLDQSGGFDELIESGVAVLLAAKLNF